MRGTDLEQVQKTRSGTNYYFMKLIFRLLSSRLYSGQVKQVEKSTTNCQLGISK